MTPELIKKLGELAFIPPEVYTHPAVKAMCRLVERYTAEECAKLAAAAASEVIRKKFEVSK